MHGSLKAGSLHLAFDLLETCRKSGVECAFLRSKAQLLQGFVRSVNGFCRKLGIHIHIYIYIYIYTYTYTHISVLAHQPMAFGSKLVALTIVDSYSIKFILHCI